MSTISIPRSLVTGTNPTEAQFDTIRSYLLNFFNNQNIEATNIRSGGVNIYDLASVADDTALNFTSAVALIKFISATPTFQIENTAGSIYFQTTATTGLTVSSTGAVTIGTGGILKLGQGVGSVAVDTMWILSRYRKPKLTYTDANIVTSENNTGTSGQSVLLLRDRLTVITDTTMSLAATANGYDAAHTGAAVSGIRSGLARANNTWYFVYGVLVQYGTDNDGTKSIMVADTTSPVQANCSTLDTRYGASKWVYLGCIRNGFNDGVTANSIVPFVYDGFGNLRFNSCSSSGTGVGIQLVAATSSSLDISYTMATGTGATDIPVVATKVKFMCYRSGYAVDVDFISNVTSEQNAKVTSYREEGGHSSLEACVYFDLPLIAGYYLNMNVGSSATNHRITLCGLTDHYA